MYSREYGDRKLNFEASGGLVNSSLVMQDQETDTYWSIMEGEAVAGELRGQKLVELPVSEKMQWRQWRKKHPDTLVLSVDGREYGPDPYARYFRDPKGFGGQEAKDDRLPTKEPIFAFHYGDAAYAVRQKDIENGKVFELEDGSSLLLYRRHGSSMFQSTYAFVSKAGFERRDGGWYEKASSSVFDPESGAFPGVARLAGFDTFWYNFSLNNPDATVLP